MNSSLQYLIYMCQVKNDLNRKRRRFYYIWRTLRGDSYTNVDGKNKLKHKSYTIKSAKAGYVKARTEMKAMTKEMRQLRKELGVCFCWNDGGAINWVAFPQEGKRIHCSKFKTFYQNEVFEKALFGG